MTDPQQQPGEKSKWAVLFGVLGGFVLGYASSALIGYSNSLTAEYHSATAIREITAYVETNQSWPTSWSDMGLQPLEGVRVNWSLNIDTCDRYDIMASTSPSTGVYLTFPHAERLLGALWNLVLRIRDERSGKRLPPEPSANEIAK